MVLFTTIKKLSKLIITEPEYYTKTEEFCHLHEKNTSHIGPASLRGQTPPTCNLTLYPEEHCMLAHFYGCSFYWL